MKKMLMVLVVVVLVTTTVYAVPNGRNYFSFNAFPTIAGAAQPNMEFEYELNFTSDVGCSGVLFSHKQNLTADAYNHVFASIDISSVSNIPSYLCEYRAGVLRAVHVLESSYFTNGTMYDTNSSYLANDGERVWVNESALFYAVNQSIYDLDNDTVLTEDEVENMIFDADNTASMWTAGTISAFEVDGTIRMKAGSETGYYAATMGDLSGESAPLVLRTPSEAYWASLFYTMSYSSVLPVFSYYGFDSGKFAMGTEVNTDFCIYTNGYGSERWCFKNNGSFYPSSNAMYDVGSASAQVRKIYASDWGDVTITQSQVSGLEEYGRVNGSGTDTFVPLWNGSSVLNASNITRTQLVGAVSHSTTTSGNPHGVSVGDLSNVNVNADSPGACSPIDQSMTAKTFLNWSGSEWIATCENVYKPLFYLWPELSEWSDFSPKRVADVNGWLKLETDYPGDQAVLFYDDDDDLWYVDNISIIFGMSTIDDLYDVQVGNNLNENDILFYKQGSPGVYFWSVINLSNLSETELNIKDLKDVDDIPSEGEYLQWVSGVTAWNVVTHPDLPNQSVNQSANVNFSNVTTGEVNIGNYRMWINATSGALVIG